MNLSKRQKTLLMVVLVGLVGLVVDRTILRPQGGPQAASAGGTETATDAPAAGACAGPEYAGPCAAGGTPE